MTTQQAGDSEQHTKDTGKNRARTVSALQTELKLSTVTAKQAEKCCGAECKSVFEKIGLIIIIFVIGGYFVYQLSEYFSDTNRQEYTLDNEVTSVPQPYIYLDFAPSQGSNSECYLDGSVPKTTVISYTYNQNDDVYMDDLLNQTEDIAYLVNATNFYGVQAYLYIPPSNTKSYLKVGDKNSTIFIYIVCAGDYNTSLQFSVYYTTDHKDQLNDYSTLTQALEDLYWSSDYVYTGYHIYFTFEWITYDNQIDSIINYDYFITTLEAAYDIGSIFNSPGITYALALEGQPNESGRKLTYVTAEAMEWTEIFSNSGGMHGTVSGIISIIITFLVWGYALPKCCGGCVCGGCARHSDPDNIDQLKPFIKRFVNGEMDKKLEPIVKFMEEHAIETN